MSFAMQNVCAGYDSTRDAIDGVSFELPSHALCAVIGPNGSGKSTLLRLLLGGIVPRAGTVTFQQRPVNEWQRTDMARHVGVVTQLEESPFAISVRELVAMGRYPHLGPWRSERDADRVAIAAAMERCDVAHFADRPVQSLSGGERQRTRIARALAQEPDTLVLDEPTAALDIAHEMHVFELLRALTREEGRTVVLATHHLNLAARYADILLLLDAGALIACGTPAHVMRKEVLEQVYGWSLLHYQHAGPGFDHGAPQIAPLSQISEE